MKKMKNLFLGLFYSPKKVMEKIQPQLKSLEEEMQKIQTMDNKVEAIVRLFQVISPIQDAGGFRQEILELKKHNHKSGLDSLIKSLEILQEHFEAAGRDKYGMNRTEKNEEVTSDKVFLGNIFGLWTNTATFWLREKPKLVNRPRPDVLVDSKNRIPGSDWDIINDLQCGGFIGNHTKGIIDQIKLLKAA